MPHLHQITDGDCGFSYNGVNYTFSDTDLVSYTYNKKNHLTRGASGQNKIGRVYKEGLKTPDAAEATIKDCSVAIYKLIDQIFENAERINFWFINRSTGESLTFKNSVIRDKPRQTSIGESEDTISFMFAVESFNVTEKLNDE